MWIKDHVDCWTMAPCPYCEFEAELEEFISPCPNCGRQLTLEEWLHQIEQASLTWVEALDGCRLDWG